MSKRSVSGISAAAGGIVRRSGLAACALAVLALAWTGASVEVRADTVVLKSGEEIEGTIIDATRNTVVVRRSIGGMRQMRIRDIDEIRVDLARGERLSGQFLSWADGIYQLRSGDEVIRIGEGAILSREAPALATRQAPQEPPPVAEDEPPPGRAVAAAEPVAEKPAAMDAAGGAQAAIVDASAVEEPTVTGAEDESQTAALDASATEEPTATDADDDSRTAAVDAAAAAEEPTVTDAADGPPTTPGDASAAEEPTATEAEDEGQTGALEAAADEAPAAMDAKEEVRTAAVDASAAEEPVAADAKGGSRAIAVKASVGPSEAGADGITFKIELSRPAEQTLVLIYGTLDGTAKAGTDYEPQQGVITLAPGTESGEVHVPLLEHQPAGGAKRFELFLMADPKFAEVVDQRIIATIHGND